MEYFGGRSYRGILYECLHLLYLSKSSRNEMKTINIARDFSRTPGARYREDGPFSGQEFRETFLEPLFPSGQPDQKITIELDGTEGYGTSFLEESFGGLARKYGKSVCNEYLAFVSLDEPLLVDEIKKYIDESDRQGK